jgi:3-phenylpropionate/cinnamic acid dioxygenase small subunit
VHVIGNVRVLGHGAELVTVASNQVISEVRRGRQNLYTGLVEHDLRPVDAGYEIARKELRLVNSELPLGNLTFLL